MPTYAIYGDTPKNSNIEKSGVCTHIVCLSHRNARNEMSYQNTIIKKCIQNHFRRRGISVADTSSLDEMMQGKLGRLNAGESIAVNVDEDGNVLALFKIAGFSCLHDIDDSATVISHQEIERFFHEQQTVYL